MLDISESFSRYNSRVTGLHFKRIKVRTKLLRSTTNISDWFVPSGGNTLCGSECEKLISSVASTRALRREITKSWEKPEKISHTSEESDLGGTVNVWIKRSNNVGWHNAVIADRTDRESILCPTFGLDRVNHSDRRVGLVRSSCTK